MRLFGLLLVSFFLVSLTSAYTVQHEYYDDNTHVKTVYYTFDKDYRENEDRFPISDYKYGYTYRASKEYLEKKYDRNYERDYFRHSSYERGRNSDKITYYEYSPYMRTYVEKTCYDSPPRGKLFYIKCDF